MTAFTPTDVTGELPGTGHVPLPAAWNAVSRTVSLDGPVHYLDFGGPEDGPLVVFVHGLGGSYLNGGLICPALASAGNRVVALDLPGFGLSYPAGRRADVASNARVLGRFLDYAGTLHTVTDDQDRGGTAKAALLIGNSMGGLISMLHTSHRPDTVRGLVLIDPVLPRAKGAGLDPEIAATFAMLAVPGLGVRFLSRARRRTTARLLVAGTLERCGADIGELPADLVEASIELVEARLAVPGADHAYIEAARSILRHAARTGRFDAMMRGLTVPVLLMHGDRDRLVQVSSARAAARNCPDWRYEELADTGHVPMYQRPELVLDLIRDWSAGLRR